MKTTLTFFLAVIGLTSSAWANRIDDTKVLAKRTHVQPVENLTVQKISCLPDQYVWCGSESTCRKDIYRYNVDQNDFNGILKLPSVSHGYVISVRQPEACHLMRQMNLATIERHETVLVLAQPLRDGQCSTQLVTSVRYQVAVGETRFELSNFTLKNDDIRTAVPRQVRLVNAPNCEGINHPRDTGLDFAKYLNQPF